MKRVWYVLIALVVAVSGACTKAPKAKGELDVAVFVPGIVSGSPIYELLVQGAEKAVQETPNATIKVIEAGYNQAEWLDRLRAVAATEEYELIVTSNPSMPELCAQIAKEFPNQKFFIADAYLKGNPSIYTVLYNQKEQGYIAGFLAGLYSKTNNADIKKIGFIAAQKYPTLTELILPGFEAGAKAVDPEFTVEYREIGNWYDANAAASLARELYASGIAVILPIAGGAGQGVISVAEELANQDKRIVWFDNAGFKLAPQSVIGCAVLKQDIVVYERVRAILNGNSSVYGRADIVGVRDGYIDFDGAGSTYEQLPGTLKKSMEGMLNALKEGTPDFTITSF
ncbi:MAG TPA: BMP family ABC transporter substrate-binding protein [Spirochaetales bacterium]|nr:BMP family ABC transporter substrate-binding protein [Spirochaetales bacterium]